MASSDSKIDKLQRGRPKRAELPDVNINTGAQSINTEKASSKGPHYQRNNETDQNAHVSVCAKFKVSSSGMTNAA